MSSLDQTLHFPGPAGPLEARLRGDAGPARASVVLCHPHPLFGGSLHNKTLFRLAKRLAQLGIPSLRFNFRGVGESAGQHDGGVGEREDVQAALDWAVAHLRAERRFLIGYSFGAVVGLRAGNADPRVDAMVGLGLPLGPEWDVDFLRELSKPLALVQGELDEFAPGPELVAFADGLPGRVDVRIIPGAGHLFSGHEDEAVEQVVAVMTPWIGAP